METDLGTPVWDSITKSGWGLCSGGRSLSFYLYPDNVTDVPILDSILEKNPSIKGLLTEFNELKKQENVLYKKAEKMRKEIEHKVLETLMGNFNGKNNKKSEKK